MGSSLRVGFSSKQYQPFLALSTKTQGSNLLRFLEHNRHVLQAVQDKGRHRLQLYVAIAPHVAKSLEHDAQRDLRFQASKGRAQAEVDAVAKSQVPVRRAADIEG